MSAPAATGVACPLCGWSGPEFLAQGVLGRANARCGGCGSLERHRALYIYLRDHTPVLSEPTRLLHFAPERALRSVLESATQVDYVSTDLEMRDVSVRMDICDLLFRDETFDCVLCSHVLEHIPDDRRAMEELGRVLKPQGVALVQVPVQPTPDGTTVEDPAIVDPEERERAFGQRDHVRKYGEDFPDRLRESGLDVEEVYPAAELDAEAVARLGLHVDERIFVCRRGGVNPRSPSPARPRPTAIGGAGIVGFDLNIAADDPLADQNGLERYFAAGLSAIRLIDAAIERVEAADPSRILDQPSGHGRVLRMLRARFPDARITACDTDRAGAEFCRDVLGADVGAPPPELPPDARYELIWSSSAITPGLSDEAAREALAALAARLDSDGLLLFTADGGQAARSSIPQTLRAVHGLEFVSRSSGSWEGRQDVYVCRRGSG